MNRISHALARGMEDPPFYYVWDAMLICGVMFWTLAGLWMWLSYTHGGRRVNLTDVFVALPCGPGAWVAFIWWAAHRKLARFTSVARPRAAWQAGSEHWRN